MSAAMRMKTLSKPRSTVVVSVFAVAVLSGCSTVSANEAAVIDGESIGEADLQETTEQFNSISTEPATPSTVLSQRTLTPAVDQIMAGTPEELTDQEVSEVLAQSGLANPSPLTLDVARTILYTQAFQDPEVLADPEMADALAQLQELTGEDVAAGIDGINPRYGEYDAETRTIMPTVPGWITPAG
ncbi:MAG: hypothetical protein WBG89_11695 [Ornithinimicrobium sp.]